MAKAKVAPKPAKVVLLSLLNEKQKKTENSELSDINQSPSFQNSSPSSERKIEFDQYFELFEKQQQMMNQIDSDQNEIIQKAAKSAKVFDQARMNSDLMTQEEKKAPSPLKNEKLKKLGSMEPQQASKLSSLHYELEEEVDFKAVDIESVDAGGLDVAGGGAPSFGPDNKMVSNASIVKD